MTPEEFLESQALLQEVVQGTQPLYEILATIRKGFIEDAGLGPNAADELVVEFVRYHVFPRR